MTRLWDAKFLEKLMSGIATLVSRLTFEKLKNSLHKHCSWDQMIMRKIDFWEI